MEAAAAAAAAFLLVHRIVIKTQSCTVMLSETKDGEIIF